MPLTLSRQLIGLILENTSLGKIKHPTTQIELLTIALHNPVTATYEENQLKQLLSKNRSYLYKKGFIYLNTNNYYALTPKGSRLLRKYKMRCVSTSREWDGNWRIVLYDIPETNRKGRIALLHTLKELGFWQLQRSVWVYPYDCEKHLTYIASTYDLQPHITYLETSYINQQRKLLRHFSL